MISRKRILLKLQHICDMQERCGNRISMHIKQLNHADPLWGEQYVDFQHDRIKINRAISQRLEAYYQRLKLKL